VDGARPLKTYRGEAVDVTFDPGACVHCGFCTKALPSVFDLKRRPWILPDGADAQSVIDAVKACPSGALRYVPKQGQAAEAPDARPSAVAARHGPLHVRGDLRVVGADGTEHRGTRFTLCRCGQSKRMPFCDVSHREARFRDPAPVPPPAPGASPSDAPTG
jgi:uncharacterized Fe-S cluster protein YjdI